MLCNSRGRVAWKNSPRTSDGEIRWARMDTQRTSNDRGINDQCIRRTAGEILLRAPNESTYENPRPFAYRFDCAIRLLFFATFVKRITPMFGCERLKYTDAGS